MTAPVPLTDLFTPEDWFTLLDVSLTGIHLVRPVYEPDGTTIVDFAIEYLNPACPSSRAARCWAAFPTLWPRGFLPTTGACSKRASN